MNSFDADMSSFPVVLALCGGRDQITVFELNEEAHIVASVFTVAQSTASQLSSSATMNPTTGGADRALMVHLERRDILKLSANAIRCGWSGETNGRDDLFMTVLLDQNAFISLAEYCLVFFWSDDLSSGCSTVESTVELPYAIGGFHESTVYCVN